MEHVLASILTNRVVTKPQQLPLMLAGGRRHAYEALHHAFAWVASLPHRGDALEPKKGYEGLQTLVLPIILILTLAVTLTYELSGIGFSNFEVRRFRPAQGD